MQNILETKAVMEVLLGSIEMEIHEFLKLEKGSVLDLGITAGENAEVVINTTPIGKGEIMVYEKNLAVRINQIFTSDEKLTYYSKDDYFGYNQ